MLKTTEMDNTLKECENCSKSTNRLFTVECVRCDGDITVCGDCVNANPRHDECPESESESDEDE